MKEIMIKRPLIITLTAGSLFYLIAIVMTGLLSKGYTASLESSGVDNHTESGMARDKTNHPANQHGKHVIIGTGHKEISTQAETRDTIVESGFEPSNDAQTQIIEAANDSVVVKALKATCPACGKVIDHFRKYSISVNSFGDLSALHTDENYQYRLLIENYCSDCFDAIAFAEDTMFGRLLSVNEVRALLESATFSQLKEAACVAGYIPPRSRPPWIYLPACEVGNSVDAKI